MCLVKKELEVSSSFSCVAIKFDLCRNTAMDNHMIRTIQDFTFNVVVKYFIYFLNVITQFFIIC